MKQLIHRGLSLFLLLALVLSIWPVLGGVPAVSAANLSTDIYQLPSKTLNDAGTKYRQNMSYIIRTRNGKIIVIDGGYSTNNSDANYLISQLKSITGKDVPNVDAWFFTHDHGDHVGCFKAIAARMPTSLTVTAVYYRFATDAEIDKYAPEADRASLKTSVQSFKNHVKLMKKADGTPTDTVTLSARHVNRCNATFVIDTVQIDVLMTCQEVFWGCDNITTKYSGNLSNNGKAYSSQTIKQLVEADFGNNTTSVFRMTTMGQSVLFLGDAAEPEGLMLKYFHDKNAANSGTYFSLKSDIVQMAHHGQNAVPKSVYVAIDPDIALWPTPDWVYTPSSSSELTTNYTKQWMKDLGVTNYVSKDGLKKISLNDLRTDVQPTIPEEMKPLIFDPTYYADKYSDLKKTFGDDAQSLYNHFLKFGIEEGRCASPYFDIKYYMSQNSLKMSDHCKGDYEKGLDHFLKYAYLETELTGAAKKFSVQFDCKYYYNNYPILKELGLKNEFEVLQYFVTTGEAAGHKGAGEVITLNDGVVYHPVKNLSAVAPTCAAEGKTEGKQCSTCGLTLVVQTAVSKLPHTPEVIPGTAATCTQPGLTDGEKCSVCGEITVPCTTVDALGHTPVEIPGTDATCTQEGHTAGSRCGICGEILAAGESIPATGHSYTYENAGQTHTVRCLLCSYNYAEDHKYVEGFCICGEPEQKEPVLYDGLKIYHSLNLASDISVSYAVPKLFLEGFDMDTVYLECTLSVYDEGSVIGTKTLKLLPTDQGSYYYFVLNGLTAVQMNDRLLAVIYGTKDGQTYYSPTDDYSIADYAYAQLAKTNVDSKLKTLCADLLRYGTAAQVYKNYRTDAYADSAMTEAYRAYLSPLDAVTFGNVNKTLTDLSAPTVTWAGKTLNLESKVSLKYVIYLGAFEGSREDLNLRVAYTDIYGQAKTMVITELEDYNATNELYAFTFDSLLAAELRMVVSAQVYEGDSPVSVTLQYSSDTYGNGKTGTLEQLCKALFAYSDSAKIYFAS
ncbi:MAG: MBL fold metallo-hydrolase [Oscillospiraceae bacterium]|nr:MBL fold metallo-hydrolase [Oscillospiraceae bacterium]